MEKILKSKIFIIGVSVVFVVALTGGSFYIGYRRGMENPQTLIVRGVANLEKGKIEAVDFGLFWEVWKRLQEKHIDAEKVSNQDMVYGAVSGLVNSLKDPNTIFFPPSDAKKFGEDISGEFSGIGSEIGVRNDQLVIIAPLKDSPAEKAGLRSGDKILKIDQTITNGLNSEEAVKLIRGEKGTTVVLTIFRDNWEKPKEISIVRDIIQIPTLDWKILDGDIAYIHLYNFFEKAPSLFFKAGVEIAAKHPKGLIIDLRDNPGGYLDGAVNIAGLFLDLGDVVVTEEFRSGEKEIYKTYGNGLLKNVKTVVLINEGSASASEILTGALRDNRHVKLVGNKSFGKGTVQELIPLKDDSVLKVTIAHWLMPNGGLIEKNGIDPDYKVDLTDDDISKGKDPQLDKAIEVLKSQI
jgi:carboxyl-terminal processing protease